MIWKRRTGCLVSECVVVWHTEALWSFERAFEEEGCGGETLCNLLVFSAHASCVMSDHAMDAKKQWMFNKCVECR